jgi:predicted metalloprotease with PDZ domain
MKSRTVLMILIIALVFSSITSGNSVDVSIDLIHVQNDQVRVIVKPSPIRTRTVTFQLPRIIPGTYSIADYGRYIEGFSAVDKAGKQLPVEKKDVNTWLIRNARDLTEVSYLVNDTYDSEEGMAFTGESTTIFSPAGTNILAGRQFMLNMAGFAGYFEDQKDLPYRVKIVHPANLTGTSSMTDNDTSDTLDLFFSPRYADLVDCPIMYAAPDIASFTVDGMQVVLHVYSPNNKEITAEALLPDLKKMIVAQKKFLGSVNLTPRYAVLAYITTSGRDDARGIGALEHNTSTTAVFLPTMTSKDLIHVISHEFFHTLTPLNIHSKEIQDFNFNKPQMSEHLWLYEGVTEYFANLFQVNQGLIPEEDFFYEMAQKEFYARKLYPADISFTEMSKNILEPEMKKLYPNVYQKGALLAMCIDLIIRDKSDGQKGILDMMRQLSVIYGPEKPFDDSELIPVITKITCPEVGEFIQKYIVNGEPVDYGDYLKLAGVERATVKSPVVIALIVDNKPYVKIDREKEQVIAVVEDTNNVFVNTMGLQNNDIILEINNQKLDASDLTSVFMGLYQLKEGDPMSITVSRDGQIVELKGNIKLNYVDTQDYVFTDSAKMARKDSWLKGN